MTKKIKLDNKKELKPAVEANEVHDKEIVTYVDSVNVKLNWMWQEYDDKIPPKPVGDPVLVSQEHLKISGTPFDEIVATLIAIEDVGSNLFTGYRDIVRQKAFEILGLDGVIEE
jgi:hypothetical protein